MLFYCVSGWILELLLNFPDWTGHRCCLARRLQTVPSVTVSWQILIDSSGLAFPLLCRRAQLISASALRHEHGVCRDPSRSGWEEPRGMESGATVWPWRCRCRTGQDLTTHPWPKGCPAPSADRLGSKQSHALVQSAP